MIDPDRAWARTGAYAYPGMTLRQFRTQVITYSVTLASQATSQNQPVNFAAGALILGITASAQITAQAGTQTYRPGLDLFSLAASYQADLRQIVGGSEVIGGALFGQYGDQFPQMEILVPTNTAILYNFTNLTTSTIQITLAHHCLLKGAVG